MRVISGSARGKKLRSPKDESVRPTLDRIKENIFNIIGFDIKESVVLDLFAGSGGLGIEALSRGASHCTFVDKDKSSITLVQANLKDTRLERNAEAYQMDAEKAIEKFYSKGKKFDYIFLDPPYQQGVIQKILKQLQKCNIMQEEGIIIVETDGLENLPDEIYHFTKMKEREYSNTKISIYEIRNGDKDE